MSKHRAIGCILADFQKFLCVSHRRKLPPRPHPPPSHSYCSAGFDWLGVDLEVRSLCYWPTPQTGIQGIEDCIHITHGRRSIGPTDVIRIVFNSYNVVFLGVANQPPCHALEGALNNISKRVNVTLSCNSC
jgi:hypothetical protein